MSFKYDALTYGTLIGMFLLTAFAILVLRVPSGVQVDVEVRKIRLAAAALVGIFAIVIFSFVLYLEGGAGQVIFEKVVTALTPLAGAIIGYITSSAGRRPSDGSGGA